MEIGIIGLPQSGKTSVFYALTGGKATPALRPSASGQAPSVGVAKVNDPRLAVLEGIFKPTKVVFPDIRYTDLAPSSQEFGKGLVLGRQSLSVLSTVDALIHVVRVFDDATVPLIEGTINPLRDISTMELEMEFSDMIIADRRLQKIEDTLKGVRAHEKDLLLQEQELFRKIKSGLENEVPLIEMEFSAEETKNLENYQFLTAKPLLVLLNIGENQVKGVSELEERIYAEYRRQKYKIVSLCGKFEMELAQLGEDEAEEFRSAMGLVENNVDKIVRLSYELVDLISFFTIVSGEVKAWTIKRGTTALKAAGKIHSDMEQGFIRGEVVAYDDLVQCGSIPEAKKKGIVRLEGKNYVVQDGDIITFLFNV